MSRRPELRLAIERGSRYTFASALDWPGWCRRGKGGDEAAIDALVAYAPRYAAAVGIAETSLEGPVSIVDHVTSDMHADFGAPGVPGRFDAEVLDQAERSRQVDLLVACWNTFDAIAAAAPASLRKGPRGGGRDTAAIGDHVREAERSYARKVSTRVPPRTPWPEQRSAIVDALRAGEEGTWGARYFIRRTAWHVLDHAWEIEDKSG